MSTSLSVKFSLLKITLSMKTNYGFSFSCSKISSMPIIIKSMTHSNNLKYGIIRTLSGFYRKCIF